MSKYGNAIADLSLKYQGSPYVPGGKTPSGFDCSGFVSYVVKQAIGVDITPASASQKDVGREVRQKKWKRGDILGFDTGGGPWSHTGIFVGDNKMMNCLNRSMGCQVSDLSSDYWQRQVTYSGARRVAQLGRDVKPDDPVPPVDPEVVLRQPEGPVKTVPPWGGTFGIPWFNITRWRKEFDVAYAESPLVPRPVLEMISLVESAGKHYLDDGETVRVRDFDDYDAVPAVGMMQVKLGYHAGLLPGVDGWTPEGNVRIAARLMHLAIQQHGTWQKGFVSMYFTGTDYSTGTTQAEYVRCIEDGINEWNAGSQPAPDPTPKPDPKPEPIPEPPIPVDTWRPYPYPQMVDLIVPKPRDGAGFDRVEFRRPLIRGFSTHITDGPQDQTLEFLRDFFGTGGARAYDALTDLGIEASGRIGLFNDWRDPNRGGTRAGWANGYTDGIEGPGLAFYRLFPRINVHLVSCEHFAKDGQAWTDAQIASTIEIRTAIAQELKCPWDSYPIHPAWGISIEQAHTFFSAKRCPSNPYLTTYETIILAEVAKKLRAWQTGSENGDPLPPIEPEPVVTYTDLGMTLDQVSFMFGTMDRYNEDGTVDELPFNPDAALSQLWLRRCERDRIWPEAESIVTFDAVAFPGKEMWAMWEGGWTAVLPVGDTRASWMWLDEIEREAA